MGSWHREKEFITELEKCVEKATETRLAKVAEIAIDDEKQVSVTANDPWSDIITSETVCGGGEA